MAVDYGALQPVNALGSLMGGIQAGKRMRQDQDRQNALRLYAEGDIEGAAKALIASGDVESAVAVRKEAQAAAEQGRRKTAVGMAARGDVRGAREYARSEGDIALDASLAKLGEEEKAAANERANFLASYAAGLKNLPEEARRNRLVQDSPMLVERGGLLPQQIAGFDPTDEGLDTVIGSAMDLKTRLERSDAARKEAFEREKFEFEKSKGNRYTLSPGETLVDVGPGGAGGEGGGAEDLGEPEAPTGGVYGQVGQIATQAGADDAEIAYLQRLAKVESNGDLTAKNGSSTGLFQFQPDTFASVGGGNLGDVGDQTRAALELSRRDRRKLEELGVPVTGANLYIMHQQGAGGGPALLTAPPDASAVAVLAPLYGSEEVARKAITGNGGRADMTAGEFVDYWRRRWAGQKGPSAGGGGREAAPQAGPKVIAQGQPKPGWRMLTAAEKQAQGLPADGAYQLSPEGKIERLTEPKSEKPPTEGQVNAASLAYAAFGGNDRMNELAKERIYKPQTATESLFQNTDQPGVLRLVARTETDRRFFQAAKEFLAPILRKDTGAAVTDTELAYYMDTYIPRFEDSPKVLWQKAQARDRALRRIYGAGRKAYDQEYGAPGKWQVLTDPRARPQAKSGGKAAPSGGGRRPSLDEIFGRD